MPRVWKALNESTTGLSDKRPASGHPGDKRDKGSLAGSERTCAFWMRNEGMGETVRPGGGEVGEGRVGGREDTRAAGGRGSSFSGGGCAIQHGAETQSPVPGLDT